VPNIREALVHPGTTYPEGKYDAHIKNSLDGLWLDNVFEFNFFTRALWAYPNLVIKRDLIKLAYGNDAHYVADDSMKKDHAIATRSLVSNLKKTDVNVLLNIRNFKVSGIIGRERDLMGDNIREKYVIIRDPNIYEASLIPFEADIARPLKDETKLLVSAPIKYHGKNSFNKYGSYFLMGDRAMIINTQFLESYHLLD